MKRSDTHVAVLMGGWSPEREVSLSSGRECAKALRRAGWRVTEIDVDRGIACKLSAVKPDVVFNALHGPVGEDGNIQGMLNILGIPYTHSGVRASAVAMDKPTAKDVFARHGLRCPEGRVVTLADFEDGEPLEPPYVIKPIDQGSSVGVHIVREGDNYRPTKADWPFGDAVLVERYVPGRELTVAVWDGEAMEVTEITSDRGFYDYEAKYSAGSRWIEPPAGHGYRRPRLPVARLPRRKPGRLPLRRHRRRARRAVPARDQHPARHDPDLAGAGAGRPSRHPVPRAGLANGGGRAMRRLIAGPRKAAPRKAAGRPRRRARPAWLAPVLRWTAGAAALAALGGGIGWTVESGRAVTAWDTVVDGLHGITADAGLAVGDVLVTGRRETDAATLLEVVGIERGMPILTVDLDAVRQRVETLPWVKQARVERHLPDILFIALTERRPLALWQRHRALALVDEDGVVITDGKLGRFASLPIVIGDGAPERAREAIAMLAREPDLLARVRALTWVGDRRWTVRLDDLQGGGIDVQLPESGAAAAWTQLAVMERDHGVLRREVTTVDLRIPNQLIVRVPPGAEERAKAPGKNT